LLCTESVQTSCGTQWVMDTVLVGVKQVGCDDNRASLSAVKIKYEWSHTSTVPYALITDLFLMFLYF
jgi:hypothetical protein